jgi:outer membrane protein OmpA-like peptidoglycan-associated protein
MDYWYVLVQQEKEPVVIYFYGTVKHVIGKGRMISLTPVEEVEVSREGMQGKGSGEEARGEGSKGPLMEVYFDFDRYNLRSDQRERIDKALGSGALSKAGKYVLIGYADWIGTEEYNLELSRKRAKSVGEYLRSLGIEGFELLWKGESECNIFKGRKVSKSLIEDLEPCRKVEIWRKE